MQYLWDIEGNKYLDFFGGILTIGVGHCNPKVTSKIKAQVDKLGHTSTLYPNEAIVAVAEKLGVSLELCGHTHGGQIFPFTWFTQRIFGSFTHGLHRFGRMSVFTTYGAGTWGPPLRVGTRPEIVLIQFE